MVENLLNRIADVVFAPFKAIIEFLLNPKNMLALGKRIFDGLETVDATLMSYNLPSIFLVLGLFFLLLGLAKATFQVVLAQRGVVEAFSPLVLPVIMFPLFAYQGAPCKAGSGSFPCVPDISYRVEKVSGSKIPAQKIPVLEYGTNGQLTLGFREKPLPDRPGFEYAVFEPELPPMPGGTAVVHQLINQSYLISRRIFYSELSIYEDTLGELRETYTKLMHSAFNVMAAVTFTGAGIRGAMQGLIGALLPAGSEKGRTLFGPKGPFRKVKDWVSRRAPGFLRSFLNFTFEGAQNALTHIAYRTAAFNLFLIESLAAIPLLLVSFYLIVVYGVFMSAKVLLYGMPLFLGLATFFPRRVATFFALLITLIVFPPIFGAFMSVSMRALFISGIKAQVESLNNIVRKSGELFFLNNPASAYMGGMVVSAVATQAENALACLNGTPPVDEEDGGVSPYGYILQSTASPIACYPSYNVKSYLRYADDPSGLPTNPGEVRAMALEIARAVSLDVAGIVGDPNRTRGWYVLPKGRQPSDERTYAYGFGFGRSGVYTGSSSGSGVSLKNILPPAFWSSLAGKRFEELVYMKDVGYAGNPDVLPPLEVGTLTRLALNAYTTGNRKDLEVLVQQLKDFVRDLESLAAKGEVLKESGDYANEFYKVGVRWEIAWPLFVDTPFKLVKHGVEEGRANLPPGVNVNGLLIDMANPPPPIPNSSPIAPYSLSLRLPKSSSSPGGAPPPRPRVVPGEEIAPAWEGPLKIPAPDALALNPNSNPTSFERLSSFFRYEDLMRSPPPSLGYTTGPTPKGPGTERIAPYLAYPYLEHYSIMNQLGEGLLSALRNLDAQKITPLVFLVVAALLAYYIFTSLLAVSQTLLEGIGASSGPLARALRVSFMNPNLLRPFSYLPRVSVRPGRDPVLAYVNVSEGASYYMVREAVELLRRQKEEEGVGLKEGGEAGGGPSVASLPPKEAAAGGEPGRPKEPAQEILAGLKEALGEEVFRIALAGKDTVVVYGTETRDLERYTPTGLANKLLQLVQEKELVKRTWSSLLGDIGEALRSWEIRLVEEGGLVGLETGAKSYARAKEALVKEGYVVEEVKPGRLAVIYDPHGTPLGYLRLAPLFRSQGVVAQFNEFVTELAAKRARSERAKWYMSLEKVEGLPYQRAVAALREGGLLEKVESKLRERMGERFLGVLSLLNGPRGSLYFFYRGEDGKERSLRLDFAPMQVEYENVERFRLAIGSRNLPGASAEALLKGGLLSEGVRPRFFREGEYNYILRQLEDDLLPGEDGEAKLENARVGLAEVGLYLARLKEFLRDEEALKEAKRELERIRGLYEGFGEESVKVLRVFAKKKLRILSQDLSRIEEGVEKALLGRGEGAEGLFWREALEDLERELQLLDALTPRSKDASLRGNEKRIKSGRWKQTEEGLSVGELMERASLLKRRLASGRLQA